MSDYYKLADKVVERAKELYYESDEDRSISINPSATTEKKMDSYQRNLFGHK